MDTHEIEMVEVRRGCTAVLPGCTRWSEETYHVTDPRNAVDTWLCASCYGGAALAAEVSGCTGMPDPGYPACELGYPGCTGQDPQAVTELSVNPYDEDVNQEINMQWMCENCYSRCADDI